MGRRLPYNGTLYNPPVVGNVNGLLGALNMGNAGGGTNWPGAGYNPELHIGYCAGGHDVGHGGIISPPPAGFSDFPYQAGVVGRAFRLERRRERARVPTHRVAEAQCRGPAPPDGGAAAAAAQPVGLNVDGLPIVKPPYGMLSRRSTWIEAS